jgi:sulfotransferase family protein
MDVGRRQRQQRLTNPMKRVCLFVGYPRSGHSLVGSILDSHPRAVIAHELDVIACWKRGVAWPQMTTLIEENSREAARTGRCQSGYSYALPGQGEADRPLVLGDKKGGRTAHYLDLQPDILSRFQEVTPWPIFLVHVIRNPLDNVATMARLHSLEPRKALESYRYRAEAVSRLRESWPTDRFLDVYLEDLIEKPESQLKRLFGFLGLHLSKSHLTEIRQLLFKKPRKTRNDIDWTSTRENLDSMCDSLSHLRRYLGAGQEIEMPKDT